MSNTSIPELSRIKDKNVTVDIRGGSDLSGVCGTCDTYGNLVLLRAKGMRDGKLQEFGDVIIRGSIISSIRLE